MKRRKNTPPAEPPRAEPPHPPLPPPSAPDNTPPDTEAASPPAAEAVDIDTQVASWRALDADASQPSGAQAVDALRALDVNTLQATVDALRTLDIGALRALDVNTLQAMVHALRALDGDTETLPPPDVDPARPAVLGAPPRTIVNNRFARIDIVSLPHGHFFDEHGNVWPFYPHPLVMPKVRKFLQEIRTIMRAEDFGYDTPKGGRQELALWEEIVIPHFDPLVASNGPFPSLGKAYDAVLDLLENSPIKSVPDETTITRWLNRRRKNWFIRAARKRKKH